MLTSVTITRLEKAASDNGFDLDLGRAADWLHFGSSQTSMRIWLTAVGESLFLVAASRSDVLEALAGLGVVFTNPLPSGAAGARSVSEIAALHRLLRRRIGEDPDSVVFFADEAGSWQLGVDWRSALPAYFQCLADGAPAEEFAREVDRTISDFADYERPKLLAAARRVANAEQKAALRRLPARERRR
jgi:hypothetical protein